METNKPGDIFINGKAQIVEMLQYMQPNEKERLLKNIRRQNTQLANELMASGLSFENIDMLDDIELLKLFQSAQASIMGMAIRGLDVNTQRRVLSLAERSYAEEAYQFMTAQLEDEPQKVRRAREKVREFISTLMQER